MHPFSEAHRDPQDFVSDTFPGSHFSTQHGMKYKNLSVL
jgi:hypothetical protein